MQYCQPGEIAWCTWVCAHLRDLATLADLIVIGVTWPPLNKAAKLKQQDLLTNTYLEALRKLAPDTGGYINEVFLPSRVHSCVCH